MKVGKVYVLLFEALMTVGLLAGVVVLLAYFAFNAMGDSSLSTTMPSLERTAATSDSLPATTSSPARALTRLPPLPVEINVPFRHLSSGGYIVQIRNTSPNLLRVVITTESDRSHRSKTESMDISPSGTIEIGWDREWHLDSGDRVFVTNDAYQKGLWTMP